MTAPRRICQSNRQMKQILPSALMVLFLSSCAGGFPPSSSNGLNEYDILYGLKVIPEGADTSRIWSPLHLIYGGKPSWSVVWFKQKTKDGKDYDFLAKPPRELENAQADAIDESPSGKIDQGAVPDN